MSISSAAELRRVLRRLQLVMRRPPSPVSGSASVTRPLCAVVSPARHGPADRVGVSVASVASSSSVVASSGVVASGSVASSFVASALVISPRDVLTGAFSKSKRAARASVLQRMSERLAVSRRQCLSDQPGSRRLPALRQGEERKWLM